MPIYVLNVFLINTDLKYYVVQTQFILIAMQSFAMYAQLNAINVEKFTAKTVLTVATEYAIGAQ